jgi:hypothetical protein
MFQGDTLDVGYSAAPLYYDWNQDGLEDILTGCWAPTSPFSGPCGCVIYLPNLGSAGMPLYEEWDLLEVDGTPISTST